MSTVPPLSYLDRPQGHRLAYRFRPGRPGLPTVLWLGGFMSDMEGTKATALDGAAERGGWPYLRFDYFAHGQSTGKPGQARIGRWIDDSLAVADELCPGRLILVGSSMGGWMALSLARARPKRLAGIVLLAPAADFTEALMRPQIPEAARARMDAGGVFELPMEYGLPPFPLTKAFLDEGRAHQLLDTPLNFDCPVRILQGMADADVPYAHALRTANAITAPDLVLTLIKQGDHRLSTPADIGRLETTLAELLRL